MDDSRNRVRHAVPAVALAAALLAFLAASASAAPWPDRRRDQFPTEIGYLVVPFPYSLPGLGQGLGLLGYFTNIGETHADAYGYWIGGDVTGYGLGFNELHLFPKTLLLEAYREDYDNGQVFQYSTRGMDTDKNDYQIVDAQDAVFQGVSLALVLGERRVELSGYMETGEYEVLAFRDRKGRLLQELPEPLAQDERSNGVVLLVDLTDDRFDPRRGPRAWVSRSNSPRESRADADFDVISGALDLYLPVGKQSTWVFDFFHSQADVRDAGETDPDVIVRDICPVPDPACESSPSARDYVANALAANRNGTSESLGGRDRLRAYPDGRFQGAYTQYAGMELRFNLTDEVTPFDYFIWRDVRTAFQLALIAETGTVAESEDELWDESRSDFGAGLRVVTASGGVYRADYVTGDEGPQITVIVNYPW